MASDLRMGPVLRLDRARVRVGTCSWADRTLVRDTDWYPRRSMTAAERLAYYAAAFPVVEADSTYYRPPTPELVRGWVERTPPGFRMNVKAYSLLTHHPTKPESLWDDVRRALPPETASKRNIYAQHLDPDALEEAWLRFCHALAPLREADKLGAVLLQFPEWFTPKRANRQELEQARARLGDYPACVEFRSPRWLADDDRDRTLGHLAEHDLTLVVVDAPPVSGLPTLLATTTPLAVVRFHGRADSTWKQRGISAAERFRYLYDRPELQAWLPHVQQLAQQAGEVHLLMNNCYRDYGVRNAADLIELLTEAGGASAEPS